MEATASNSARALEAAGATEVTFEFRGTPVTIPLRLEDWPLDAIRACLYGRAIKALLGEARPPMRTQNDVTELSHRMADACGCTPLPEAPVEKGAMFGAVPTLLAVVDNHGDDLEADLRRFYNIDYRDPAVCTLRQVWVMIRRLPPESALLVARNAGELPWSRGEIIAARHFEVLTQKHYPGRPPTKAELEEWQAKRAESAAELDKLSAREEYYRSGQNMRDAGKEPPSPPPPKQPPRQHQPASDDPVRRALAVAQKNARRTPKGNSNGREQQPGFDPAGRWNAAGSVW